MTMCAGEADFDQRQWEHDVFLELYFNDTLWVFMIQSSEEIWVMDYKRVNDPVLYHLMAMGVYNWDWKDRGELNQATRVI